MSSGATDAHPEPSADGATVALLATMTGVNFAQFGSRIVISPFVLLIVATYSVSKSEVGVALTGMWVGFALLQFPGGVLADRYGEKPVILLSLGLTVLGSALVVTAPTFLVFGVAVVALGIGTGLYFAVGTSLLARRARRRGRAFGIHSAGGPLAGLTLPVVATAVAAQWGWRSGVAVGGVVAALAFVLVVWVVDETPPTAPDVAVRERLRPRIILDRLTAPGVPFTIVLAVLGMYAFQSFVSFFPTFLQEYHGLGEGSASLAFGVVFALSAVGLAAVGSLADSYGTPVGLAVPFGVAAAGFLLLIVGPGMAGVAGGVLALGLGFTWAGPLQSRFMDLFAGTERGSGFGMVRSVFVLVGSVGNAATGVFADVVGWPVAYGVVVGVLLLAAGLVVLETLHG